jgi:hypothetical protein
MAFYALTFAVSLLLRALSSATPIDTNERSLGESEGANVREITVDASTSIGQLKNLQGTTSADTKLKPPGLDVIDDMFPAIANLWPEYGIHHVLLYNWPDVFMGFGKTGSAGNASLNDNYNWTVTDKYVRFATSHGAKASIQFGPTNGMNDTVSSPQKLGEIGFMITDRYMNGAHKSGFKDALELFDFYAEADLLDAGSTDAVYEHSFQYFAGFAHGVAKASSTAGVGAWGGNRAYQVHTNYSLYDPFVSRFYADCKKKHVPIKAATYHFSNAQYSLDPYDVKRITDHLRNTVLVPAGLPDLPIWVTEFEANPSGIQPTSPSAIASYNDPSFFAAFTLGVAMYAQDTYLSQAISWTGFGYGGTGAGDAPFQPWFNRTASNPAVPLPVAAAWKLQAELVLQTPHRLSLEGSSSDGFAALAGLSGSKDKVQILLNNYQPDYNIAREIAAQSAPLINASTAAHPLIQTNGLFNGEQACFNSGTQFFVPVCQTYVQATIRNNTSNGYDVVIEKLPWGKSAKYRVEVQRVGGGSVHRVVSTFEGTGKSVHVKEDFPANAQDLITVTKL